MIRFLSRTNPKQLHGTVLLSLNFDTQDDWRLRPSIPTIKLLLKTASRVVVVSHHGRPKGFMKKFSLRNRAAMLGRLVGKKVTFVPHFDFKKIKKMVGASPRGSIFLLENMRFNPGEWKNDSKLAKQLATLADFYVNDDFATVHHENASNVAVTRFLPSYAGLELENEIAFLSRVMKNPKRPLVFVVGGAKAADKLDAIKFFQNRADWFLVGGGVGNTILATRGIDVKKSIRDTEPKDVAALRRFARSKKVLTLVDFRWHGDFIWDIGSKTIAEFAEKIARAKTILWSGPLGMIEKPAFARGSIAIARAIAKNRHALSVTGGGETVMFLKKYHLDKKFSFISTGGGAMIDFLAGKKLPGIVALEKSRR